MILLTKSINELLKANGLEDLTITRDDSGYIAICGKACLRPVMTFTSIKVGTKLTAAEREIMEEDYLKPLIETHAAKLKTFIGFKSNTKAVDELATFEAYSEKVNEFTFGMDTSHNYSSNSRTQVSAYVRFNKDGKRGHTLKLIYTYSSGAYKLDCNFEAKNISDIYETTAITENFLATAVDALANYIKHQAAVKEHEEGVKTAEDNLKTICQF